MIKTLSILIIFATITIITTLTPCQPFGLRIYYGDFIQDQNSPQKLSIYFNTKQSCPNSFVNILSENGFKKIMCNTKAIKTSSFANFYTAYIQVCSISDIPLQQTFRYTVYGWDFSLNINPTPFKQQWIDVKLIDPRDKNRNINMVVLADWGTIQTNINIMTPITKDLKRVLNEKEISGIIIAGDIAYDLDSNNGTTYEKFLNLMQEVSTNTPIFIAPGNHERNTVDAMLLFKQSFKVYGVDVNLASGLNFGSLFLTLFDPYSIIYSKQETISSLDALKVELAKGQQSGRFILPYSHYPMICSGQYTECYDGFVKLHDYFDAMLQYGVSLYVGAHTHSYERTYPYFKNHSFVPSESPYTANGQFLVSVVEGVAGNDRSILAVMPETKEYTARYTVNETGFAVLESTQQYVKYSHFSTKQGFMDEVKIIKSQSSLEKIPKLRVEED